MNIAVNGVALGLTWGWQDEANVAFVAAFPEVMTAVLPSKGGTDMCQPINNTIENNRYCKCKIYADVTAAQASAWHSTLRNNTEVYSC
jgi:hypothetical protein